MIVDTALILAAGRGKRLKCFTKDRPKCLIEVQGKPILQYQLEALESNCITNIVVVIGYKGEMIKKFCRRKRFKNLEFTFIHNKEWKRTNSAYSWWLARKEIKEVDYYIHLNCDIIFFPSLLKKVVHNQYADAIILDTRIGLSDNMEQVLIKRRFPYKHLITKMQNTLLYGGVGKAVGIARFSHHTKNYCLAKISEQIAEGNKKENFYGVLREGVNHIKIFGIMTKSAGTSRHFVYEINTVEDYYEIVEQGFGKNKTSA